MVTLIYNKNKMKIVKLELLEFIGVAMRIFSFSILAIMSKDTPLFTMWVINTLDAILLTYCAWKRNNRAYVVLNVFWLIVGIVGMINSF
jgi:hypothetical protein